DLDPSHIRRAPATLEGGYEAAKLLLTESPEITAVFAYNDIMAMGALRACRDLGRQVPHDCAIIGFDDIRLASISSPSLSTVRIDKYELGRAAISRLLEMLQNPTQQFMPLELPVQLMLRESTLPPVNS
ncbi:MAG: substrate-binding domain-containing protein, partial [Anaerolineales bacterium]|nr:substrate-binding domain-containing protein [Anaerolineales bacterium]